MRCKALLMASLMLFLSQSVMVLSIVDSTSDTPSILGEFGETRSDTTHNGNGTAWMASDIHSGVGSSSTPMVWMSTLVGDTIYFDADSGAPGREVWAHDNSNSSTWQVTQIAGMGYDSNPGYYMEILVGDTLYFSAQSPGSGHELWAHDTSNSSTWQVAELNLGSADSNPGEYLQILVGDTLYFSAKTTGSGDTELWAHDTSNSSTWLVDDIRSGSQSSDPGEYLQILVGDTIYFDAEGGSNNRELWAHDTSNSSTWQVVDINSGGTSTPGFYMDILVGDTIYFSANGGSSGAELWAHDTSNSSTWMVDDINSGGYSSPGRYVKFLVGDTLYFSADDGVDGNELWAHDTSNSSTWQVADINTGADGSWSHLSLGRFLNTLVGDTLYFRADGGSDGSELWAHDTSNSSTWQVADINTAADSNPGYYMDTLVGDALYFSADDGSSGYELWAHDTSNSSTWMVDDINSGPDSSFRGSGINLAAVAGDALYFRSYDGSNGDELWALGVGDSAGISLSPASTTVLLTNNTAMTPITFNYTGSGSGNTYNGNGSTWQIADINSGAPGSIDDNSHTTTVGTRLYFAADDGVSGQELWAHESTNSTTWRVTDINSGAADSLEAPNGFTYGMLTSVGTRLYFAADDGVSGMELWTHETTNSTTWQLADINPGDSLTHSFPGWGGSTSTTKNDITMGTRLYFSATHATYGTELYVLETTNDTTWMVADIRPGSSGSNPNHFTAVGTRLYFSASDGSTGYELWAHETTNDTSWLVSDIHISSHSTPEYIVTVGTRIYFNAEDGSSGHELWAHESTNGTTWLAADIRSGFAHSNPKYLTVVGTRIYFNANDGGGSGDGLWAHETTNDTSWQVTNISASPRDSITIGTRLYFKAHLADGSTGVEFWAHETTNDTSWMVTDIISGSVGSFPSHFAVLGTQIYFKANDGSTGYELWAHDPSELTLSGPSAGPVTNAACEISPALPTGISIAQGTCTISGTPTVEQSATSYTVWANESSESASTTVSITINGSSLSLLASSSSVVMDNNTAMTPITFNYTGSGSSSIYNGNETSWVVADINPGSGNSDNIMHPIVVGTRCYFHADDGIHGKELWAYETTNDTTWMVADIRNGGADSSPGDLLAVGTRIFFYADDGIHGKELWAHEMTNDSTWMVADTNNGTGTYVSPSAAIGTRLFFSANDGIHGYELWAHEMTNDTTWMVADINNGSDNSIVATTLDGIAVGSRYYFSSYDGSDYDLWVYETTNDTIWNLSVAESMGAEQFILMGSRIYFRGTSGGYANIWAHETTNDTTWKVTDASNDGLWGATGWGYDRPSSITKVDSKILFIIATPTSQSLWIHDTTNDTTWNSGLIVIDWHESDLPFAHIGSRIFFRIDGNGALGGGENLGAFEISNETSWEVDDIVAGNISSIGPSYIRVIGTQLIFQGWWDSGGSALWMHDPIGVTVSGPSSGPVTNAACEISPTLPTGISIAQGTCTISGTPTVAQNATSYTVWANESSDSTSTTVSITISETLQINPDYISVTLVNNTTIDPITFNYTSPSDEPVMIKNIRSGSTSSSPNSLTVVGNTLYFQADDGINGAELWKSNGTASSTVMVKDINSGGSSSPDHLTVVGNTLYFEADDGTNGAELWKSDGTASGTVMVKDISSGGGSSLNHLTAVGNTLFFKANDGTNGGELWKSDGTASGTVMVKDINSGGGSSLNHITAVGNTLFFKANGGTNGAELWKSDGTANGTVMVKDILVGVGGSSIDHLTAVGNTLYFQASDGPNGKELWKSDGTDNGTVMVKNIHPSSNSLPEHPHFTAVGNTLFFKATDGTSGSELWKSDGTVNGTVMIKDIYSGSSASSIDHITVIGNTLYFQADDGTNGAELWKSDGTANGTVMITDIYSGSSSSFPNALIAVGNTLYFQARDGTHGKELWMSDGTENGTVMVKDIYSGASDSLPNSLTAAGNSLYFQADDGINGEELWGVPKLTWAVYPNLPSGLTINSSNGNISGIPTMSQNGTNYTVWANITGFSVSAIVNITIEDPYILPAFTSVIIGNNTDIDPITFNYNSASDEQPIWAVYPSLPTGLTINSSNGNISGIPTMSQNGTNYTVWANITGNSASAIVNITIIEEPYLLPNYTAVTLINNSEMSVISFTNMGGTVDTWQVDPALPAGLTLDSTGNITGTPTVVQVGTNYTIWGNNTGGSDSVVVNITIGDLPSISPDYTEVVLNRTMAMDPIIFNSTGGIIHTWEVEPELPAGLSLNATGVINGTPTEIQIGINYTIWANNSIGSDSVVVNITVNDLPPEINYVVSRLNLTQFVRMNTLTPSNTGGDVVTWEISETLFDGLFFNTSDGSISGIPTTVENSTNFTIWANNSGGSDSATLEIIVSEPPEGLIVSSLDVVLVRDVDMESLLFTYVGGAIDTWELEPSLPAGLSFDVANRSVIGTPSEVMNTTNYTIWANGSEINDFETFSIVVLEDTDGDTQPDELGNHTASGLIEDLDDDGDGIPDLNESASNPQTNPLHPDTDGDGYCDGEHNVTIRGVQICEGGPDAFPTDPEEWIDTDGDEIGNNADLDDDGDQASDILEIEVGTDPLDPNDFPTDDTDGDGWTDAQEDFCGTDKFDNNSVPSDYDNDEWCDADDPDDDGDQWFDTKEVECGTDPLDESSIPGDDDGDGICNGLEESPAPEEDSSFPWWLCAVLLMLILIIVPIVLRIMEDEENSEEE